MSTHTHTRIYIYIYTHIRGLSSKICGGLENHWVNQPQLWWVYPSMRPWSHAFQSASAPSCPGDFGREVRIWATKDLTPIGFFPSKSNGIGVLFPPPKYVKHHFPAHISIRMNKTNDCSYRIFFCWGKINMQYQFPI